MRRLIATLLGILLLFIPLGAHDSPEDIKGWPAVYQYVSTHNIIVMEMNYNEPNAGICTGIVVSDLSILTAAHCILPDFPENGTSDSIVMLQGYKHVPMTIIRYSIPLDLALLTVDIPNGKWPIVLDDKNPAPGTEVAAIGFHTNLMKPDITVSHVLQVFGIALLIDQPHQHGYSGGPLVNSAGWLVGVNVRTDMEDGIGFSVPVEIVRGFLGI